MSCFRSLRARRPELAQAQLLQIVFTELKRAKRTEEEEQLYRESIDGATQIGQLAGVFGLAADRGDVNACSRSATVTSGCRAAAARNISTPAHSIFRARSGAIVQCMTRRADLKAHDDVLRILDHELAVDPAPPGAAYRPATLAPEDDRPQRHRLLPEFLGRAGAHGPGKSFPRRTSIWMIPRSRSCAARSICYKRDDLVSDLVNHFRQLATDAKTPADASYPRLALASVLWWNDDKDDAIAEFTKVAEASKPESELRLDLAELLEQQGDRAGAMAGDRGGAAARQHQDEAPRGAGAAAVGCQRRSRARPPGGRAALRPAARHRHPGQLWRARCISSVCTSWPRPCWAALAAAPATRPASSSGMMSQYQRQGQLDVAVQVAMQILRSTNATRPANVNLRLVDSPDASRTAAISVLARSGKLPQLIERALEQLKKTPNSIGLHQTLADYYQASGQRDKARDELAKIVALRPDDTTLRLQVAQRLGPGKPGRRWRSSTTRCCSKRIRPCSVVTSIQFKTHFSRPARPTSCSPCSSKLDFRKFGQAAYVVNMLSNLFNDQAFSSRAAAFMKKAWEAFPDERSMLIQLASRSELWQMPEMEGYLRRGDHPRCRARSSRSTSGTRRFRSCRTAAEWANDLDDIDDPRQRSQRGPARRAKKQHRIRAQGFAGLDRRRGSGRTRRLPARPL